VKKALRSNSAGGVCPGIECVVGHVLPLRPRLQLPGVRTQWTHRWIQRKSNPVGIRGNKVERSMVMVPAGQRAAHSPATNAARPHLSMTEPAITPSSSALMSSSVHAKQIADLCELAGCFRVECNAVQRNKLQAVFWANVHASPHKMQEVASAALPVKDGIDPAVQAGAELRPIADSSSNPISTQ